ncbi:MAG: hypothetical protein A4C66_09580 [Nitrospira sp. HN-bin3]|jgi:hypothetical protein|uniref:hypothetical protein n=1 Tax=Nitrospira cf. moscoviensis SBR1015 TaxID=96242 RepID=UPI000A0A38CF|nr:hypothetical protein [Nitrospira cf. moscoviensis SBR1015]MBH0208558.1 hypothetical protein [Nitrospira sp.]OQW42046.1 MAG: hypothetical protein A4C66_09580 [Nitrospira sp. HN-bin3]
MYQLRCALTLIVVAYASLSACTHENKYRADLASPLTATAETGMTILSVGSPVPCHALGTPTGVRIFHASGPFFPYAALYTLEVNNKYAASEFSDHHGHLYILQLPPGKYVLVPFLMNPYGDYLKPPKADFEVHASETVYLGEFFLPECQGDIGMSFVDHQTRDLALLVAKNPKFAQVPITKRLLMFTGRQPFWPF